MKISHLISLRRVYQDGIYYNSLQVFLFIYGERMESI